jgi:hypothetical protein
MDCSHRPYLNLAGKLKILRKKTDKNKVFLERAARLSDNCMTIVILSPEPAAPVLGSTGCSPNRGGKRSSSVFLKMWGLMRLRIT